jgi:hypothetical protein
MRRHQELRDQQAEHGVAQELEPLVARGAVRRVARPGVVGQRLAQQLRPREAVAEALAQRGKKRLTRARQ